MELLAFAGGLGFAAFFILFFIAGIVVSEFDSFFMGTLTLISGLAIMQWVFGVPIWASIVSNPFIVLLILGVYIAVGSMYTAFWRFPNFINKHKDRIQSNYESYIRNTFNAKTSDEFAKYLKDDNNFENYLDSNHYEYKASKNKDRLSSWVLMWPFAVAWELMHKPAIWLWETIYYNLGDLFDNVSKRTARGLRKK